MSIETSVSISDDLRRELAGLRTRIAELEEGGVERLEAVAMMASGFSHEVNNLMSGILGAVSLVRGQVGEDHPCLPKLETIETAAEKAGELTRRMLAFTQGKPRKGELVNLNAIAYHVLLADEQRLAPRIRIVRYIDPDLWRVAADHAQMAQVFLNIAINAVEAIPEQGRVVVSTRNIDLDDSSIPAGSGLRPGRHIMLTIEDNGTGMTHEALTHIFDAGFSTKSPRRGLGLATVYSIIKANKGYIGVTSTLGHGTAVRVYLPAAAPAAEPAPAPPTQLPRGTETVLVVDDERMILDVMVETLNRLGYKTLSAHNGQEAVEVARAHEGAIDLCLLDMAMPIMGGAEAYPMLRRIRPGLKVIVCTGFEEELVTNALLSTGVSAILLKPFRPTTLAHEIRKVLDQKKTPA